MAEAAEDKKAPEQAPPCEDCEPKLNGDRALGALAILFGTFLLAIGIDLATGGALSRAMGAGRDGG